MSPLAIQILIMAGFMALVFLVVFLEYGTKYFWRRFVKEFINRYLLYRPLQSKYRKPIEAYFDFYKNLNENDQKLFRRRVEKFIGTKEFIPRGDLKVVTPEMKALIAACAIQVTFGYPHVYFEHFWRILVHPDTYYSRINNQFHAGEVNLHGGIILSWVNFIEGYIEKSDGRNVGLHEMAHAMHFENGIRNGEFDFIDSKHLDTFLQLAREETKKIQSGEANFFREYATQNQYEFFAVAIENFFERPRGFKEHHPQLYLVTCQILKQDPLAY